jgi:hypothetical protein
MTSQQEKELAIRIKPEDTITTLSGRNIIVGSIELDEAGYWVVPKGAHEFTYWIPLPSITHVNNERLNY